MSRHQPLSSSRSRYSKEPPSSSLWPPSKPSDQHGRYPKRPASGTPHNPANDADDTQKRRRLLLEMDDWTGARAQKPLAMTFPIANPDTPAWGWSGEAEAEAGFDVDKSTNYRIGRQDNTSYSVKKFKGSQNDSRIYNHSSSSSTMYARSSRPSLRTPFTSHAPKSSLSSQPVSGTLSTEERERFESEGVGILSPLGGGVSAASAVLDTPRICGALRAPETLLENRIEELAFSGSQKSSDGPVSRESSMDREQTPSDIPEDLLLGVDSPFEECPEEDEKKEASEESAEESEAEDSEGDVGDDVEEDEEQPTQALESSSDPEMGEEELEGESTVSSEQDVPEGASQQSGQKSYEDCDDDDVQLVPLSQREESPQEEQAHEPPPQSPSPPRQPPRQRTQRTQALGSRPAPTLTRDTSNLSEASRAAALFEAQRVTIRDIPDCNVSEDPIEDSESELEMVRRARSAQTRGGRGGSGRGRGRGRGRGARGSRRANTRRQGW